MRPLVAGTTCAILADGGLWCWGSNHHGQLGDGTTSNRSRPVRVGDETATWASVSASDYHTCAIAPMVFVVLGATTGRTRLDPSRLFPRRVGDDTAWASVAAGDRQTCAIRTDGGLWCWGNTWSTARAPAGRPRSGWATTPRGFSVAVGGYHTCAIRTDQHSVVLGAEPLRAGGRRTDENNRPVRYEWVVRRTPGPASPLGTSTAARFVPTVACGVGEGTPMGNSVMVAAPTASPPAGEPRHDLGRRRGQRLPHLRRPRRGGPWCWGNNFHGQLGDSTTANRRAL